MAIAVTSRGNFSTGTGASVSSSAFTPANGTALVAVGFMWDTNASGNRLTFSDSFADAGGGAWTQIVANDIAQGAFGANSTLSMRAYYRVIGTTPGSHTVTANGNPTAPDNIFFAVAEVSGAFNAALIPAGQTVHPNNNGDVTCTLPHTPDAASVVFSACTQVLGAAPGTPAGYTNLVASSPFGDGLTVNYDITSPGNPTSYTGLQTAYPNLGLAFEVTSVPGTPFPAFTMTDTFGDSGGGVWTKATGTSGAGAEIAIWYRRIGVSAVSGHVVSTAFTSSPGRSMSVMEMSNRNTANPVPTGQFVATATTNTSVSEVMPTTPSADSVLVAGVISRGDGSAPGTPTGHVSLTNVSTGGDGYSASYVPAGAGATTAYSGLASTENLAAVAEIRSSATGPAGGGGGTGGGGGGGSTGGQPFTSTSTWNTAIPANATFVDDPSLRNSLIPSSRGWLENGAFGISLIQSSTSDPLTTISVPLGSWGWNVSSYTINVPSTGTGATGTDGSMCVVTPSGEIYDFWQFARTSGSTGTSQAGAHCNINTSDGWAANCVFPAAGIHAAGNSCRSGLIVNNELTAGINHGLAIAVRADLATGGWICPAINGDGGGGSLPTGQRLGIPPGVVMPSGMPVQVQSIWKAMQFYGGFIIDTQGASQPIEWWCDINSVSNADVSAALGGGFDQLNPVVDALRLVR